MRTYQLYPCCKVNKHITQVIEKAYIKADYNLVYNCTPNNEKAFLRAKRALYRLQNNVIDGVLYCTFLESREIHNLLKANRIYTKYF